MAISDPKIQFREYIEAVRRAAYAEGYAAAKMEFMLSEGAPVAPAGRDQNPRSSTHSAPFGESSSDYVPKTIPRGKTRKLVEQYLRAIAPRDVTATEIVEMTKRREGIELASTSVRRALDFLKNEGLADEISDTKTWKLTSAASIRSVK
jgi:hypothetical protein